ncbi:MmcB family DNA repair protein [Sandarakinorhabdus sp.]|uniref:MmcB family DNA repair protein n=1 Tax=Sandarakinorhabdus sp. TaxID=1916663 RepID=UPI003340C59A
MFHDSTALDVLRGTCRLLRRAGISAVAEVSLANSRRVDLLGIDTAGRLTIVEIKISLADLRGDHKWPEYLDYCDQFFWAVPASLPLADLHTPSFRPDVTGLIVADRFDAEQLRPAALRPLNSARRRAITTALAHRAALRWHNLVDPDAAYLGQE